MCPPGFAHCLAPRALVWLSESCMSKYKARFYFFASVLHRNFFASVASPTSSGNQGDAMSPAWAPQWHKIQVPPRAVTASVVPAGHQAGLLLPGSSTAHSHPPATGSSAQKGCIVHHLSPLPLEPWSYQLAALRCLKAARAFCLVHESWKSDIQLSKS